MLPLSDTLLARTLRTPGSIARYSMSEWDVLVRQARAAGLLARLAHRFRRNELTSAIPAAARWHFEAAETLAAKQQVAVRWELQQVRRALRDLDCPLIVLKGAAYVAAGLPAAEGRLFNDIDLLVPREQLARAESALMLAGWHASGLSEYDKRYYRRWMHEIPPLQHVQRDTVIDLHHAILPETARYHPDTALLHRRAVPVDGLPGVQVLAPEDRILHSATHVFHDGELPHGLRDLTDLDLLLRDASDDAGFWTRLVTRADELQLGRSLYYALRYARHFLDTPVPDSVIVALDVHAPGRVTRALMDRIFTRVLAPDHASCADAYTPAARLAAFVRAHWLRMPAYLLIPHLFHKAFISPLQRTPKAA
ncbi:MAG: nucleotidyltransferase family protein [Thiobacillus sp.]|uniref:nucleotidyltransferase domain-containing protein n=1 Tax=Thiobacillus sp. TaxID=924 RepID=UPI002736CEB6|nr:nucleotidyltransferase family protein [Thiobacillus sp.]MDP3420130.1 nucleotidyltransferase family protein [Thiobacillus sp.]MDP3585742.1 nucleotidyltransferase family protein [Thiobacillus sp.]